MIPNQYLNDRVLLAGATFVESCANGKNDQAFLGDLSLTRNDGSFCEDALQSKEVVDRFLDDHYIEPVPNCVGWYRKVKSEEDA